MVDFIISIVNFLKAHWLEIVAIYGSLVAIASIVVKLTPQLGDDIWLKRIVEFIGRYIAINRTEDDKLR